MRKKRTPATTTARTYHHGDLRHALIDQAARLASREGLEAVTLRRVAKATGVSHTAPYHHFKNKADLLAAVGEEGFKRLDRVMARASETAQPAELQPRLHAMGKAYVQFAAEQAHYFRVMFRPEIATAADPAPDSARESSFNKLVTVIQQTMGEEGEPSDRVLVEVLYAWSLMHGLASLWLDGPLSRRPPFSKWGLDHLADQLAARVEAGQVPEA